MNYHMEEPRQPVGQNEPLNRSSPQEIEIAYILQNSQPGDRNLVDILVDPYAEEIHWLIQSLLFRHYRRMPSNVEIYPLVVHSFVDAISHCDRFWGEASVRKWLYTLAIKVTRAHTRRAVIRFPTGKDSVDVKESGDDNDMHSYAENLPPDLDDLSERQYLTLVLHAVFGFEIEEVAEVLGEKTHTVHKWQTNLRHKLIYEDLNQINRIEAESQPGGDHKINRSRIQARIDGLIKQNSEDAILLREHLSVCEACNTYDGVAKRLWERLKSDLNDRLPHKRVSNEYLEQLKQSVLDLLSESTRDYRINVPLRKAGWIALLLILFASGTWALIRITPDIGEFPPTATPTTRYLPTPISPGELSVMDDANLEEPFIAAYALGPKISADGRWVVFSSNVDLSGGGDYIDWLDIYLYDTQSRTLESISSQVMSIMQGFYTSPDISSDGRWIVYNGVAGQLDDGDEPCRSLLFDPCIDIFLYDRINRQFSRLTHEYDGGYANGHSMAPSISSNGRWIVFWSAANNLVDDDAELCEGDGQNTYCADLYIYDRINGGLEKIGIGRKMNYGQENIGNLPAVDISDDGLWLLLTIQKTDRIADQIGLQDENDIFILSREREVFIPVDAASDGTFGNGLSSYGRMTPDGRYIAFHSTSDNLVAEDDNGFGDIFLLDRNDGKVELISKASDGTQADGESGIDIGTGGKISISDGGRYIVYTSTATNLDPDSPGNCKGEEIPCIFIYIHDIITSDTDRLEVQGENHFPLMADISDDGRTISFLDVETECANEGSVCLDLNLYDRERTWMSEITRNLFPRSERLWEEDTVITTNSNIKDIEISPADDSLAVVSIDNVLEIWSIANRSRLHVLQGEAKTSIAVVAYSPDGEYIAGGASDGTVNIWRTSDGSLAFLLNDHPGKIMDLQFSTDGEYLFVTTPKAMWGWQINDRKFTRLYMIDYADIKLKDVDISPSNNWAAVVPANGLTVWIQRLPGGDIIHRLSGHGTNVSSVSFSPGDGYLIAQYQDGMTQLWRLEVDSLGSITPRLEKELVLSGPIGKLTISPDGAYAAVVSSSGVVWLWELTGGKSQLVFNSEHSIYIADVAFSPSGKMLAASSRNDIHLWRNRNNAEEVEFFRQISTDEFIQIPNRRRPLQDAITSLRMDNIQSGELTLYQADDQSALDVFAPSRLPANIFFVHSSVMSDSSVLSHYRVDDRLTGFPIADLYLLQHPISETFRPFWVGASGVIEPIEFNGRSGEYVKGDWVSLSALGSDSDSGPESQDLYWAWSSEPDVQQLRWRHMTQLFSLTYIHRQKIDQGGLSVSTEVSDGNFRLPLMTKYDLVEIASGITRLETSSKSEQILIGYIVKAGDTCTSIAYRYDTTIDSLIRINKLTDNCEVIIIGQTLQVPLPNESLPLTEADLDCDGKMERLRFIPVPDIPDPNISYGFILDSLSEIGLYETVWQYTIGDLGAEYMIRPQLLTVEGCQQLLALNVMPVGVSNESDFRVFGWDGESMKLVFTANGWLQSVTAPEDGDVVITTLKLEYIPGTSTCNRTDVIYIWDGEGFDEIASSTEENGSCGIR